MPAIHPKFVNYLRKIFPENYFYPKNELSKEEIKMMMRKFDLPNDCRNFHDNACVVHRLDKLVDSTIHGMKVYAFVHFIPLLLYKRKQLRENPKQVLKKTFKAWLHSMLFTMFGMYFARSGWCDAIKLGSGKITPWKNSLLIGFASFMGFIFEYPSRRQEITMFVFPRSLEVVPKTILEEYGIYLKIPFLKNFIFAIGVGIFAYLMNKYPNCLKSIFRSLFYNIMGGSDSIDRQKSKGSKDNQEQTRDKKVHI